MNNASTVWLVIFALSASLFFVIAGVVAVKGFGDLQKLLRQTKRHGREGEPDLTGSEFDG